MMSKEIEETFLNYFKDNKYSFVEQHSLIPPDDTIYFTNSGMCQFKDIL